MTRSGGARWTEWALRLSLATAFLSAVGDRLGAWGPHGSPHASWGDWHHFRIYADRLNWYMPAAVQPTAAVLATAGEAIFAIALITGFRLRGGNWVRGASYDFRDFDGADPRNEGAARLFRVYCCDGSVLARRNGRRSQARNPRGRKPLPYRTRDTRLTFAGVRWRRASYS